MPNREQVHLSAAFETDYFVVLDRIRRAELGCSYFLCGRLSTFNVDSTIVIFTIASQNHIPCVNENDRSRPRKGPDRSFLGVVI